MSARGQRVRNLQEIALSLRVDNFIRRRGFMATNPEGSTRDRVGHDNPVLELEVRSPDHVAVTTLRESLLHCINEAFSDGHRVGNTAGPLNMSVEQGVSPVDGVSAVLRVTVAGATDLRDSAALSASRVDSAPRASSSHEPVFPEEPDACATPADVKFVVSHVSVDSRRLGRRTAPLAHSGDGVIVVPRRPPRSRQLGGSRSQRAAVQATAALQGAALAIRKRASFVADHVTPMARRALTYARMWPRRSRSGRGAAAFFVPANLLAPRVIGAVSVTTLLFAAVVYVARPSPSASPATGAETQTRRPATAPLPPVSATEAALTPTSPLPSSAPGNVRPSHGSDVPTAPVVFTTTAPVVATTGSRKTMTDVAVARPTTPAPSMLGDLRVTSQPVGAEVSLNGVRQGRTPLTIRGLRPGSRVVSLDLPGYARWSWSVAVVADSQTPLAVKLQADH